MVCVMSMHLIGLGYSYSWNAAKEGNSVRTARRLRSLFLSSDFAIISNVPSAFPAQRTAIV